MRFVFLRDWTGERYSNPHTNCWLDLRIKFLISPELSLSPHPPPHAHPQSTPNSTSSTRSYITCYITRCKSYIDHPVSRAREIFPRTGQQGVVCILKWSMLSPKCWLVGPTRCLREDNSGTSACLVIIITNGNHYHHWHPPTANTILSTSYHHHHNHNHSGKMEGSSSNTCCQDLE